MELHINRRTSQAINQLVELPRLHQRSALAGAAMRSCVMLTHVGRWRRPRDHLFAHVCRSEHLPGHRGAAAAALRSRCWLREALAARRQQMLTPKVWRETQRRTCGRSAATVEEKMFRTPQHPGTGGRSAKVSMVSMCLLYILHLCRSSRLISQVRRSEGQKVRRSTIIHLHDQKI